MAAIRVGCCGFPTSQARYWKDFDTVEVQQTFYSPPRTETLARWREQAPPGAAFLLKCWQVVTHPPTSPTYRRLRDPMPAGECGHFALSRATRNAWQRMRALVGACGASFILLQSPPSFVPPRAPRRLRRFLAAVDCSGLRLAWEWRGRWDDAEALALCRELSLTPAVDPFVRDIPSGPVVYLRLHGGPGYRHRFTDAELAGLARRLRRTTAEHVWCLFNNISMREDARRLRAILGS